MCFTLRFVNPTRRKDGSIMHYLELLAWLGKAVKKVCKITLNRAFSIGGKTWKLVWLFNLKQWFLLFITPKSFIFKRTLKFWSHHSLTGWTDSASICIPKINYYISTMNLDMKCTSRAFNKHAPWSTWKVFIINRCRVYFYKNHWIWLQDRLYFHRTSWLNL